MSTAPVPQENQAHPDLRAHQAYVFCYSLTFFLSLSFSHTISPLEAPDLLGRPVPWGT